MLFHSVWKEHKNFFKYISFAVFGTTTGWVYYQINRTREVLENALDTTVLQSMDTYISKEETLEDEIIEIEPYYFEFRKSSLIRWVLDTIKFNYARRLLSVAKGSDKYYRTKAANSLADMPYLDNWHYALIANMIDPRTAVALARIPHADKRLFLDPPYRYHNYNKDQLINAMREFLISVYEKSQHPCMGYFLSKAFVYEHDSGHIVDNDSSSLELSKFIQTEKEVLPMCLESLLHHCSVEKYSKDIADLNGLPLLMEVYKRYPDDINVIVKLCQILSYMSYNKSLLVPFCKSGWIGVLSSWTKHDDVRVSIPAARALANLDDDNDAQYPNNLYILHPITRTKRIQDVDVIFVHGLLGGVFFTWRQRRKNQSALGLLESLLPDTEMTPSTEKRKTAKEYLDQLKEKLLIQDYEVVWTDIPVNANEKCAGPFTCPGDDFAVKKNFEEDQVYTYCWPKDWLGQDCKNIRVIGINYDTNLSMWTPLCPLEKEKLTLDERSELIAKNLINCDVGNRPIVWITHSMGGLIVKNILQKGFNSADPKLRSLCMNTRGIVFYSTPHIGSKMANLSNAVSLVLWPSVEVQELKENSPRLKEMHEEFLKIVKEVPMRVVSFVELKSTVVTAMKFNFRFVDLKSGNPGVGEYYEIPQDHLGICKPENRYSFLYQKVLHLIKQVKQNAKNPELKQLES
ncbi:protein SERAC1 isoform X2 [Anthonomus grandis grandis]|uniref:protein SERAC1 isoform X2 n=1 Tax=Anthonomus grandis grandis TaxID=2921223 RepID=UPI0021664EF0|nr:protein SERAC1 isoform X2 [Anthonomus grandis grandis]